MKYWQAMFFLAMDLEQKPHTGILREENIALRQILGYRPETIQTSPYNPPQIGQYLPGTFIKDALLVSVDIDTGGGYEVISPGQSFHIGVSIFDTRCLVQKLDPHDAITSYQFINTDSRPCKWAAKSFLFGETELITLPDFASRIDSLTKNRDYVLVAHGAKEDVKVLNNIDPNIVNRAAYILDTVKAAQFPLQLSYRYSIEKLLDEFGIAYAKLHAAGNDAHFALKALLMIAVRDGQMAATPGDEELFHYLDAIAHAPCDLPVWTDDPPTVTSTPKTRLGVLSSCRLQNEVRGADGADLTERTGGMLIERRRRILKALTRDLVVETAIRDVSKGDRNRNRNHSLSNFPRCLLCVLLGSSIRLALLSPCPLDEGKGYMISLYWPESERMRFEASKAQAEAFLSDSERAWLKEHWGNEFKFLAAYELSIYKDEDREEGRAIMRTMMAKEKESRENAHDDSHLVDHYFSDDELEDIELQFGNSKIFLEEELGFSIYNDEHCRAAKRNIREFLGKTG
ncbi:hypothetical protein CEP52_005531 [Fusarium oligoseptatum]|uniref:Gfd2/YDR514C-like C-terminal domain-containing protein n=1 Tax=Fusarium oligoseptatum TaxID=2604345 RepID=A0A428TXV8_9HYPO|nr:hypothetical protein CEP52_005531 [Fusarium oligoseptatum]